MLAGHVGVALAIGRAERRLNVGVFVTSALLLDILLWSFILLGWESVIVPTDFAAEHQASFVFPYSHGLLAAAIWSALAGALAARRYSRLDRTVSRAALLVAGAVFSHWLLDALVHRPEMPLLGSTSTRIGLSLWNNMAVALIVEAILVVVGVGLFLPGSGLARGKSIALAVSSLALLAFTAIGMTMAPPPPSARAMAGSSLVSLVAVCAVVAWLGGLSPKSFNRSQAWRGP
jgi:membrane-bound metal-dependent hydrolase YbcI (DUF457 family)